MKNVGSILAFLLLGSTMADARMPAPFGFIPEDRDIMAHYRFDQVPQAQQNSLHMTSGGSSAISAQFPFMESIIGNFKAQTPAELRMEFHRKLSRKLFISVTYTHRKHHRNEDPAANVSSSDFVCAPIIAINPATGHDIQTQDCYLPPFAPSLGRAMFLTATGRTRSGDGLEVAVEKTMGSRMLFRFSGAFQNQKIYFSADSRNVASSYKDSAKISLINQHSQIHDSAHNLSWDWSIKAKAAYVLPHNITVGAYFEMINGLAVPIWRGSSFFGNLMDGTLGKPLTATNTAGLKVVKYMDLKIEKDMTFRKYGKLSVSADVFNIFNMNRAHTLKGSVQSLQFLQPHAIVNPRVISFELRYNY